MQGYISIGINMHIDINMNMIIGIRRSINVNISTGIRHIRISLNVRVGNSINAGT